MRRATRAAGAGQWAGPWEPARAVVVGAVGAPCAAPWGTVTSRELPSRACVSSERALLMPLFVGEKKRQQKAANLMHANEGKC